MTLAELKIDSSDGALVARIKGEVDLSNSTRLRASLLDQMTNDALGLVIDLTEVRYLDSAGIQVVYELSERLRRRGQKLRLVVRPDSLIARTLQIVDAGRSIGIADTTDAALAAMRPNKQG
jgi:anti-sigma B factor antagonist